MWYSPDMDELGLEITPRLRGRAAKPLAVSFVRELKPEDMLLTQEEVGVKTPALKRLGSRHHSLAKALASGMKPGEAGIVCGYSASRVSILKADPSFQELVEFYKENVDAAFVTMHEKIAGMSEDALEELQARLEEEPESFSNKQLLDLVTATADRSGHGPQSTQVNVNVGMAERLQNARKRVAEARKTLELERNDDGVYLDGEQAGKVEEGR